jgi:hypothetical protein
MSDLNSCPSRQEPLQAGPGRVQVGPKVPGCGWAQLELGAPGKVGVQVVLEHSWQGLRKARGVSKALQGISGTCSQGPCPCTSQPPASQEGR